MRRRGTERRGTEARTELTLGGLRAAVPRLAQPGNVPAAVGRAQLDPGYRAARTCASQPANAREDSGPVIAGGSGRDDRHDFTLQLIDRRIRVAPREDEGRGIEFPNQVADLIELKQPRA